MKHSIQKLFFPLMIVHLTEGTRWGMVTTCRPLCICKGDIQGASKKVSWHYIRRWRRRHEHNVYHLESSVMDGENKKNHQLNHSNSKNFGPEYIND